MWDAHEFGSRGPESISISLDVNTYMARGEGSNSIRIVEDNQERVFFVVILTTKLDTEY